MRRRTVLLILAILVLISIALRYPLVEHERAQTDSYSMHYMAKAIRDDGYAKWTYHPLSYFGYYPLSYPSGAPFLLSELASLTGLEFQATILLYDMMLAILFCLAVFCFSRQFIRRPEYLLLAVLFAITGARFVDTTYWDGSARGVFVVLLTITVFASFRAGSTGQSRLFIIVVMMGLCCFATHHMAALLLLFGTAYVLAVIAADYLLPRAGARGRHVVAVFFLVVGLAITVISFGFFEYFEFLTRNLEKSALFDVEPRILSILLNAGVSYTSQIGLVSIVAIIGIPSILRYHRLKVATLFPIALLISFIPFLGNPIYVSMLLSPSVSILGCMGLARLAGNAHRKTLTFLVILVLCAASVALPLWSSSRWNSKAQLTGDVVEVEDQVFNDANYAKINYQNVPAISNVYVLPTQLAAMTDLKFLVEGVSLALSGYVSADEVKDNVTFFHAEFPKDLLAWYEYQNSPDVFLYVLGLMAHGIDLFSGSGEFILESKELFSTFPRLIIVVDNHWPAQYVHMYGILPADLLSELRNAEWQSSTTMSSHFLPSYQCYQSERSSLYMVEMPI